MALVLLGQVAFCRPLYGGPAAPPPPSGWGGSLLFSWRHVRSRPKHNKFLFGGWLFRVSGAFAFACRVAIYHKSS